MEAHNGRQGVNNRNFYSNISQQVRKTLKVLSVFMIYSFCLIALLFRIFMRFQLRFQSESVTLSVRPLELSFSILTFSPLFRHFSLQGQFPGSDMNNRLSTLNLSNGAGGDHLSTNGAGFPSTLNNAIPRSNSLDASSPTTNNQVRNLCQFGGSYRFSCCSCLSTLLLSSLVKQSLRDSPLSIGINDVMF